MFSISYRQEIPATKQFTAVFLAQNLTKASCYTIILTLVLHGDVENKVLMRIFGPNK
jgi:hypothetical protein